MTFIRSIDVDNHMIYLQNCVKRLDWRMVEYLDTLRELSISNRLTEAVATQVALHEAGEVGVAENGFGVAPGVIALFDVKYSEVRTTITLMMCTY